MNSLDEDKSPFAGSTTTPSAPLPPTMKFHYIKTAAYREVVCHGVIGNVVPSGSLWLGLFAERLPLPRLIEHAATFSDTPGHVQVDERTPPIRIETREGVVRVVEVGVYLDARAAVRLRDWLSKRIEEMPQPSDGL